MTRNSEHGSRNSPSNKRVARLKKPHPCGGYEFVVVREGPMVTLRCRSCESIIRMTREKYGRAVVRSQEENG